MQFASFAYLVSLALAATVYFAMPLMWLRNAWLLLVSLGFYYSLSPFGTIVLLSIIAIGYAGGLALDRTEAGSHGRRAVLVASVGAVVLVLAVFKYADFVSEGINLGIAAFTDSRRLPLLGLALPVGISFWTFQTVAYLVDVSRMAVSAEPDPLRYSLFISFFGHVTSGPIARAGQLLPQLADKRSFSYEGMKSGLLLMAWGFFKKLMVADYLAVFVQFAYRDPQRLGASGNSLLLLAATVAFSIQIYCDFSGYTDIVRGSARIFGIDVLPNFDRPYFARSVKEFWQRWHMSLMSWLRDYVYFPLGGSRVPTWRRYANIIAVFLISGIWHGAGITFVLWGLLNAVYQIAGDLTRPLRMRLVSTLRIDPAAVWFRVLQALVTFALVTTAWVFFRATSLGDAVYIVSRMWAPSFSGFGSGAFVGLELETPDVIVAVASASVVFLVDLLSTRVPVYEVLQRQWLPVRWVTYLAVILAVVLLGRYGPAYDAGSFTYFRF